MDSYKEVNTKITSGISSLKIKDIIPGGGSENEVSNTQRWADPLENQEGSPEYHEIGTDPD